MAGQLFNDVGSMFSCPLHITHLHRHTMLGAEVQPAQLVVLETIPWSLDLYHSIAPLLREELDQVRHSGPVGFYILQQTTKPVTQMLSGQAAQCLLQ